MVDATMYGLDRYVPICSIFCSAPPCLWPKPRSCLKVTGGKSAQVNRFTCSNVDIKNA